MVTILTDSFEGGLGDYVLTPYGGYTVPLTNAWAHHGNNSVSLSQVGGLHCSSRDFINPLPDAEIFYWIYVHFDSPMVNPDFPGNANGIPICELRNSIYTNYSANVIHLLEAMATTTANAVNAAYRWTLCSFHMDMPHYISKRLTDPDPIVAGRTYKVVTSYAHTPTTQTLKLWIDDAFKGSIQEDYAYNFVANCIYLGSTKTEYGGGLASGVYMDCIGVAHEYPVIDPYSNLSSLSIDSTIPNVGFTVQQV